MTKRTMKGKHYMTHPADLAILRLLPREGETLGFHVIAATVKHLTEQLNSEQPKEAPALETSFVSGRMVSMKTAGLVAAVPVAGTSSKGWQRTKKGELHYAEETGETLASSTPTLRTIEGGTR